MRTHAAVSALLLLVPAVSFAQDRGETSHTTQSAASSSSDDAKAEREQQLREWLDFNLEGVHPFVGATWGGGFDTIGISGNGSGFVRSFSFFDGNFIFALQGGVFIDNHQLQLEISPFTYFFDMKAQGPAFQLTGRYAYFIPLYDAGSVKLYYPIGVGFGFVAGANNTLGLVYFQPRADLIGLGVQIGHMMLDFHLPSFRYGITDKNGTQGHILSWVFGLSASYVF